MEERFLKLETTLAFQEHTIKELNDVIYQQSLAIDRLEKLYIELKSKFTDESPLATRSESEKERPPHY